MRGLRLQELLLAAAEFLLYFSRKAVEVIQLHDSNPAQEIQAPHSCQQLAHHHARQLCQEDSKTLLLAASQIVALICLWVLHVVLIVWQPLRASNVTAQGLLKGYQMPWLTPWISASSLRACLCARAAAAASPSSHHLLHIFPYLLLHSCTNPSLKPHLASEWLFERSCYIYLVTFHILHANHALLPSAHQLPAPPLAAQECCCYREVLRLILHPYRTPTAWQEPTRKHIIFMILLQLKRLSLCHFLELQNQVCF